MDRGSRAVFISLLYFIATTETNGQQQQEESPPTIIHGPSSVNALVGETVNFSCTISNADITLWFVNGSPIDTVRDLIDSQTRKCDGDCKNGVYIYQLNFTIENNVDVLNNSNISCVGFQDSTSLFTKPSQNATLRIQDALSSPTLYYAEVVNSSVSLRWIPPYTMLGVQIDCYLINVTITTLNNKTMYKSFKADATDSYSFEAVDNSSCTVYDICIQAVTADIVGKAACEKKSKIEAPKAVISDQVKTNVTFEMDNVLVTFIIDQYNCPGSFATSGSINIKLQTSIPVSFDIPVIDNPTGTLIQTVEVLKNASGGRVTAEIVLSNSAGSTTSEPIIIGLSCVEEITISLDESEAKVECAFAPNCDPKNCTVMFQCDSRPKMHIVYSLESQSNSKLNEEVVWYCGSSYRTPCENATVYASGFSSGQINQAFIVVNRSLSNCWIAASNVSDDEHILAAVSKDTLDVSVQVLLSVVITFLVTLSIGVCIGLVLSDLYRRRKRGYSRRKRTATVRYPISHNEEKQDLEQTAPLVTSYGVIDTD